MKESNRAHESRPGTLRSGATMGSGDKAGPVLPSRCRRTPSGLRKRISNYRFLLSDFCFLTAALCLLVIAWCLPPAAFAQEAPAPEAKTQAAAPAAAGPRIDPQAKELLDKIIQALGGQAFLSYKTMSSTGRAFSIYEGQTMGFAPFHSDVEPPDKRRFAYGKGQQVILLNNGNRGWQQDRFGLIRQKPETVRRWQIAMRYSLEGVFRHIVREPGTLVLDGGTDFVDLLPARVLDISDPHNVGIKVYLERTGYLPIRISYRIQNPETREWDEYSESYSDYQNIQGIQTPMRMVRYLDNERTAEYFLNTAEYNKEFPPGYFEPRR
jgi:hypothetical protein